MGLTPALVTQHAKNPAEDGWATPTKAPGYPAAHARARYRCFLPDLAGLAGMRCAGPSAGSILPF